MDWLTKMNNALDYIENNLTSEIDYQVIAQKACCSSYNFQRMFSFIADVPLSEYIRRRRLTAAALDLQNGSVKILDLAIKYGYDSPVSFTRAFQLLHGITPTDARQSGATLKAYPRISFQITIKGETAMDYRIETKEAFDIFGVETLITTNNEKGYYSDPHQLWEQCWKDGEHDRLLRNSGDLPIYVPQDICKIHAALNYRKTKENTFPYMMFSFVGNNSNTDNFSVVHIPAQTYAIFPSERYKWEDFGSVLFSLQKRFYSEWLPTANYEKVDGPEFEIYGGTPELGYIELWYPVIKK